MRFRDPDSGKTVHESFPKTVTDEDQRTTYAIAKSEELRTREAALLKGAPAKKNVKVATAVETYFTNESASLKPGTLRNYREASAILLEWARVRGIELGDDVKDEHLVDLCAYVKNRKKRKKAKGAGRKTMIETPEKRGVQTVTRNLRELRTILTYLRRLGLLPLVSGDGIKDNLKAGTPGPSSLPKFHRPRELAELVRAARRHDEDTFALTRAEKVNGLRSGNTPRHDPVLPYLAFVLLTGMRRDEARLLRWARVDLDAAPAGVITLKPEDVKTKRERQVDLVVSMVLVQFLASKRLQAGNAKFVFGVLDDRGDEGQKLDQPRERPMTTGELSSAKKRLMKHFGAPRFTWKNLRSTCGTYLANAQRIFGGASAYRAARQLGHSVAVAEKHYLGVVHVAPAAKTLEAAMEIEDLLWTALGLVKPSQKTRRRRATRG